jgi:predicted RNase H-related nuclease YkuK (DUF458 family)
MKITKVIEEAKLLCKSYGLKATSIKLGVDNDFEYSENTKITTSLTVFYKKENVETNFTVHVYDKNVAIKERLFGELVSHLVKIQPRLSLSEAKTEIEY